MDNILKRNIVQHLGIVFGSILFAIAYSWFLIPYKIAPGGIGGLGQILFHFLNVPIGVSMIMFNVPLFVLSFIFLGKRFGLRSLFGMFTTAIFADLLSLNNLHKIGIIKDITFETRTGELIHVILKDPTDYVRELNLEKSNQGDVLIPYNAIIAIGDFVVVSEEDLI